MIAVVSRIVGNPDDAEDAMQESLERIWKLLSRIHQHPNPQGYILRVCMTAAYDALRRRGRLASHEAALEDGPEPADPPAQRVALAAEETEAAMLEGMRALPDAQRRAVLLRLVQEEPFETIALELGCSPATARSHYSKGRARLRTLLGAGGQEREATG